MKLIASTQNPTQTLQIYIYNTSEVPGVARTFFLILPSLLPYLRISLFISPTLNPTPIQDVPISLTPTLTPTLPLPLPYPTSTMLPSRGSRSIVSPEHAMGLSLFISGTMKTINSTRTLVFLKYLFFCNHLPTPTPRNFLPS